MKIRMLVMAGSAAVLLGMVLAGCEQGEWNALAPAGDAEAPFASLAAQPAPQHEAPRAGCAPMPPVPAADLVRREIDLEGGQSIGAEDAPVTMVIFFDYSCPFCKRTAAEVDGLMEGYGESLRVVFKHAPLPMHETAGLAARAALAAGEQDSFWEFHNALVQHKGAYDRDIVTRIAADLNLNLVRFERDLDSERLAEVIEQTTSQAVDLDVRGRPASFINGRLIEGNHAALYTQFIDEELGQD